MLALFTLEKTYGGRREKKRNVKPLKGKLSFNGRWLCYGIVVKPCVEFLFLLLLTATRSQLPALSDLRRAGGCLGGGEGGLEVEHAI